MEHAINVEPRTSTGKGGARKLRATGQLPGVLYGHKEAPQPFAVDPHELRKHVNSSGYGRNTVLKVQGLGREVLALLKSTQVDPVRRHLLHIDLIEVRETEQVTVKVPVELIGKPAGVTAGGTLQQIRRMISLNCTPLSVPKVIKVDVSHLEVNEALHISDISFPEGISAARSGKLTIATVVAPPAVEEKTEEEEAEAAAAAATAAAPAAS